MITFLIIYFIIPIMFFGIAIYVNGIDEYWTREVKVLGLWKLILFLTTSILLWPILVVYLIVELYKNT